MRKHPIIGKLRATLGMIVVTAAGVAGISFAATTATPPALAASSLPNLTTGPMGFQCYANDSLNSKTRYVLTNVFLDQWDLPPDVQSGPVVTEAIRYRYHVSRQHWDGSQYVIEFDWEAVWGGPTQYVPISDSYLLPGEACKNLTGFEFGVRAS
jgi:hypothetical protein